MDRRRIRENEFVEFGGLILHGATIKGRDKRALARANGLHEPDIAIVDIFVIIIPQLHNAVAHTKDCPATNNCVARRVERLLQFEV